MRKTNLTCREGVVKKAAPTAPVEGGVNHNEELCAAFRALADLHDARGQFRTLLSLLQSNSAK